MTLVLEFFLAIVSLVVASVFLLWVLIKFADRRDKKSGKLPVRPDPKLSEDDVATKVLRTLSRKHNAAWFIELSALCSLSYSELREALDRLEQKGLVRIESKGTPMDELISLTENGKLIAK